MAEVEFIRELGAGAMATVHLAREPSLKRLVAVKALRPEFVDDDVAVRRFQREAQSAARITHANVCQIHSVGTTGKGVPFIVMEYVEGRTLDSFMAAEGKIEPPQIEKLLAQIGAALAAAHSKGVIHRDVRPENILIEKSTNRVVLTDFGIAAVHESGTKLFTRLTRQGEQIGSPDYQSPEQIRGESATEASDIYSLGLIGVDLLNAGALGGDPIESTLPVPLYAPVPEALQVVLKRCLADKPAHRPEAAALCAEFEAMSHEPAAAAPPVAGAPDTLADAGLGFLAELRRRKVYRVAAGYAAGTLILIEGTDLLAPTLRIPAWVFRGMVAALLAGFPVAVTLAWLFDYTKRGLERTRATGADATRGWGRLMLIVLPLTGLGISVALAGLVGWWILLKQ